MFKILGILSHLLTCDSSDARASRKLRMLNDGFLERACIVIGSSDSLEGSLYFFELLEILAETPTSMKESHAQLLFPLLVPLVAM